MEKLLEMRDIEKSFPGVKALDGVNITLYKGEILAIVGENGAGKSTLMKILSGLYSKTEYSGEIMLEGKPTSFKNPKDSANCGIQMIYQEVNQIMDMTIAENIGIQNLPTKKNSKIVDYSALENRAAELLQIVGMEESPSRKVRGLSTSQQQMISIAKALNANPKILVLDEPTSALTLQETKKLFDVLRKLKENGVSSIYISHRLEEVFDIADRITVMRDGKVTGTLESREEYSPDKVIKLMVGRNMTNLFPPKEYETSTQEVLRVENLSVPHRYVKGKNIIQDVNFSVRKGEILGIAGLVGSGRSELVNAIIGMLPRGKETKIYLNGKEIIIKNPQQAKKNRIALISEDRRINGFVGGMSIRENTTLAYLSSLFQNGILNYDVEKNVAEGIKDKLSIKAPNIETKVRTLSGGNQQKVVVGKWLVKEPQVLIMDEPTRGIDVGAKYEIYSIMRQLAASGVSIIMISSELVEIIGMSDRVMVVGNGHMVDVVDNVDLTEEKIMKMATMG